MKKDLLKYAAVFLGLGWYIAFSILLGIVGGLWLDNTIHTRPLFTLLGLFLGLAVAFSGLWRMAAPFLKEDGQNNKKETDKKG